MEQLRVALTMSSDVYRLNHILAGILESWEYIDHLQYS
jgi:hypothetical protein